MLKRFAFVGLIIMPCMAFSSEIKLKIEGLEGELKQNVDARLSVIKDDLVDNGYRTKRIIRNEIMKGLRAKGYYEPEVTFDDSRSDATTLVAQVNLGKPIKVSQVNLAIIGDGEKDPSYQKLADKAQGYVGEVLNHDDYESVKKSLTSLAVRKGYFDSELTRNELGVSPETFQSIWNIDFETGKRYRFGEVRFHRSQIQQRYLEKIVPFKEGDYYTSEELAQLNRQLSSTNWFRSITVAPRFDEVTDDKSLPLDVILIPRKPNSVETGIGYSTSIGPRMRIAWNKPWINSYGHSFTSDLSLSKPEQELIFGYKIPLLKSPLVHYYTLQGGFKREDNNDTESNSIKLNATRHWDFPAKWKRAIGLTMTYDRFTQGDVKNNTFLIYPTVSISRLRSDGSVMPMWGDYQQYSMDFASKFWQSDINLWAFQAQNTWIRSLSPDNHRFILRGSYGYIHSSDFSKVPPSMRYFAGGDRSIRGYGYKSISPKDDDGKLKGANRLAIASLEYQYNVSGPWWVAAFVDTGQATDRFTKEDIKTGAGLGVRWASPVGPVKFDIAVPASERKKSLHFYIGLGPEL